MTNDNDMKFVKTARFGGPEVLKLATGPRPEIGDGDVLVRVAAAGVNRPDIVQRLGNYPPPPGVTDILGLEVAGVIVEIGTGVSGLSVGQRVCTLVAGGGYAQFVAVPAPQVLPIPDGLDEVAASAIPKTFFTVWANVFQLGALTRGETLLVHGGASGIGTTAIQLASALGDRVFATVRNEEKAQACRDLGADAVIDYTIDNFSDRVLELTDGRGADVILDMRGGEFFAQNMRAAALRGRLVSIASLPGHEARLDIPTMMRKRLTITGSTLRGRPIDEKGAIASELEQTVWPLIAQGIVQPRVSHTLPFGDAATAHRMLESNTVIGKLVLTYD